MGNQITDVKGLKVGQAQDNAIKTGVSILAPDQPAIAAVHILGGGPATRECDALGPGRLVQRANAIVLSGGSVYGLSAADTVTQILGDSGHGYGLQAGVRVSPVVPSAAIYDLTTGTDWDRNPYPDLAHEAMGNLGQDMLQGAVGAGTGAMAGQRIGGVCTAATEIAGHTVGIFCVVNSFGGIKQPDGQWGAAKVMPNGRQNTTLCVVATDAPVTHQDCIRIGQMASAGMARAIRPVFTPFDGDLVFTMSTGTGTGMSASDITCLGAVAADLIEQAVMDLAEMERMD